MSLDGYLPKRAFIAEFAPKRALVEIAVDFSSNRPGELLKVAAILTKRNVNILSGVHDSERWTFFADVTEAGMPLADIVEELRKVEAVTAARVGEVHEGIAINRFHFPLLWGTERAIIFRVSVINDMFARLTEILGQESRARKVMLYHMGEAAGEAAYATIKEWIGTSLPETEIPSLLNLYTASGWGVVKLTRLELEKNSVSLRVYENFECLKHQGSGASPQSHFFRGNLAGFLAGVLGKRMSAVETACLAQGKEYCEFVVSPVAGERSS